MSDEDKKPDLFAPRLGEALKSSQTPTPSDSEPQDERQGLPANVRVENASAPMKLDPPEPGATGPWVVYTGIATVRTNSGSGWKAAGVNSDKSVQWNFLNKMRLPKSKFSDDELHYLLEVDGRFKLVED